MAILNEIQAREIAQLLNHIANHELEYVAVARVFTEDAHGDPLGDVVWDSEREEFVWKQVPE